MFKTISQKAKKISMVAIMATSVLFGATTVKAENVDSQISQDVTTTIELEESDLETQTVKIGDNEFETLTESQYKDYGISTQMGKKITNALKTAIFRNNIENDTQETEVNTASNKKYVSVIHTFKTTNNSKLMLTFTVDLKNQVIVDMSSKLSTKAVTKIKSQLKKEKVTATTQQVKSNGNVYFNVKGEAVFAYKTPTTKKVKTASVKTASKSKEYIVVNVSKYLK